MLLLFTVLCLGIITSSSADRLWGCSSDADCAGIQDRVCHEGDCVCPAGQQPANGGLQCVPTAPYHTSACVEDHQCYRLVTSYQCRRDHEDDDNEDDDIDTPGDECVSDEDCDFENAECNPETLRCEVRDSAPNAISKGREETGSLESGSCRCLPGFHFYLGRCWPTKNFGEACTRSEECVRFGDVFSSTCDGVCQCAEGYVLRQRGDCRMISRAPGEGCVLDQDCDFENAECNPETLRCQVRGSASNAITEGSGEPASLKFNFLIPQTPLVSNLSRSSRSLGQFCSVTSPCAEPFECSFGSCVCPRGYYAVGDEPTCYAELGSPSTPEQCFGLFAEVRNGICTCFTNFISDFNNRDCIKAVRSLTDSCVSNLNCLTYGPGARCGEPQLWEIRTCECDPELSVWDEQLNLCRLFAGIGEACQVDSDCLVGDLEIQCVISDGQGVCTCPEGYFEVDGLCLTTGLSLGDSCQVSVECTETPNTVCENGRCSCDSQGYMEVDGVCLPMIGGICEVDDDCTIANTKCFSNENETTSQCECVEGFVGYDNFCYTLSAGHEASCEVDIQCQEVLGENSLCQNETCQCTQNHHHRDSGCWPVTGLFAACRTTSQCFLAGANERTVCRNSLCQCEFDFPFDEETQTCLSSAGHIVGSFLLIKISLLIMFFK